MLFTTISAALLMSLAQSAEASPPVPQPGIWTNNEDAYFAEEEGRSKPEWVGLRIDAQGRWQRIDPYGQPASEWQEGPIPGLRTRNLSSWEINGSELRRARVFTCWASLRKFAGKADGSEDWSFEQGLTVFDQGGRVTVGGKDTPRTELRLRNVTWAKGGRNKPALVLYVHKAGDDRAVSYAWASPGADLVGINLRWFQGSCSLKTQ